MHKHDPTELTHHHIFHEASAAAERGTYWVMWISAAMMILEILGGWWFNSIALMADGWHMSSHTVAIGLSTFAYAAARRYANDTRFAFGTWKIEILAGFSSALMLLMIAAIMAVGSLERLWAPQAIHYPEATAIALLGLLVNLICAIILAKSHDHDKHDHPDDQHAQQDHQQSNSRSGKNPEKSRGGHHHDVNLRSAYVHVLADAATSALAILALLGGWVYGWVYLDSLAGLIGAIVVALWSKDLMLTSGNILLDREMHHPIVNQTKELIENGLTLSSTCVTDLHVWRVGKQAYSCALTLLTHDKALTANHVKERLATLPEVVHLTVEIHHCYLPEHAPC